MARKNLKPEATSEKVLECVHSSLPGMWLKNVERVQ
jgi:hypothetical protein